MGTTSLKALRYPDGGDTPYVHLDLKNLADDVDKELYVATVAAAPPGHKAGRRWFTTDTKRDYRSDGTNWEPLSHVANGAPNPMFGTYGGQPLQLCAGFAAGTADANSILTVNLGSIVPWSRGLMSFVAASTNDPNHQIRVVRPAASATTVQIVLRRHDTGAGAGAASASIQWIAVGW